MPDRLDLDALANQDASAWRHRDILALVAELRATREERDHERCMALDVNVEWRRRAWHAEAELGRTQDMLSEALIRGDKAKLAHAHTEAERDAAEAKLAAIRAALEGNK